MSRRIWIAQTTAVTLAVAAATFALAQSENSPATQPTTQQAAYDRLLGGDADRYERPILPSGRPTMDRTTGEASIAPGAPQLKLRREGTHVINQTGRLATSSDGQGYEFIFNSDSGALEDPPMKVLPNLKLAMMENEMDDAGGSLQFRVTGMVTEYRGRNYILLEKVVMVQGVK